MNPELYQTFARYNQWMNEKLYAACAALSDDQRKENCGAFFGSLHSTLNHLLFGDRAWMKRFTGRAYMLKPIGEDIHDDFGDLKTARRDMDKEISEWAAGLTEDWLAQSVEWKSGVDGATRKQPRWRLASHMFNHQTHHRGQATTLLSQRGIDIGSTDLPFMPD